MCDVTEKEFQGLRKIYAWPSEQVSPGMYLAILCSYITIQFSTIIMYYPIMFWLGNIQMQLLSILIFSFRAFVGPHTKFEQEYNC